ncbi:hypothetical protein [Microcystis aeruginosa]|uniref:hypothetical protein n=1 Tax=Microcystis aeruginosa TaxID=1126 RepID=UPI0005C5961E|nr:hypothetical protein [Microcystis aeruginosa]
MEPRERLPQIVIVVAVIQLIFSLFGVIAGLLLMFGGAILGGLLAGNTSDAAILSFIGFLLALLLSSLSIVQFASSIGLFSIQKWAWYGTVVTQAIGLLLNVICIFTGNLPAIFGVAIGIAILWVMLQFDTRRVFGLRI